MPKKLDLMNGRFFYKNTSERVHDSLEDKPIAYTGDAPSRHHYDFSSQFGRDRFRSREIYHTNEIVDPPKKNKTGEYVTCSDTNVMSPMKTYIKERPDNTYEYIFNDAAAIYKRADKLKSTSSGRIGVGRVDKEEGLLWKQVKEGRVPGGKWSASRSQRKPLNQITTEMGPGDYDITAWEKGRHGISQPALKFNSIEIGRLSLEVVPEGTPCPSPSYYFRETSPLRPSTSGTVKFGGAKRFEDRSPRYLKTTGLLLSHDFDRASSWETSRANLDLKRQVDPRTKGDEGYNYGVDFINPDVGTKITFKTEVEQHPMRFAPSFKSKSQVGLPEPRPETGRAGPGEYRGACDKSCIEIKMPNHKSSSFLTTAEKDIPLMGEKYDTLRPRFRPRSRQTVNDHTISLNATSAEKPLPSVRTSTFGRGRQKRKVNKDAHVAGGGGKTINADDVKLSHIAQWTKTKMTKIYPRLAKEKYGNVA